jgi:hypothetical protein
MGKYSNHVPPALKHGIYSGLGLLPTESRAKFRKLRKQIFAELNLVGGLEQGIGEEIVLLEWRRQNLFTYDLAQRARSLRSSIHECVPSVRWDIPDMQFTPHPESPSPEVIEAARKRADKQVRTELGAALELVKIGDVATLDHLEKRLAILDRLDAMIARAYTKLARVRAIKSMSPPSLPAASPPLLKNAA